MNYISINIGGKDRGFKFNTAALDIYWSKVNFNDIVSSSIYASFYAGLMGNDIAKGVQVSEFDYEQVTEWVDELIEADRQEDVKKVCELFAETTAYKKRLETITEKFEEITNEEIKKKTEE